MDSEEMASKLLAGVPSVFWHNIPESHLLVARELPGVRKQSLRAVLRTLIKMYTFAPNFKFGTK